jgi:predicted DNA-binding protein (MmcQ/YjbR family)
MNIETLRKYCLSKPGTEEGFPFDESTLVFKVGGKIFALTGLENVPLSVNLKCDPVRALELRERYDAVQPGYHMNKKHWNTVTIDGRIPAKELRTMIDHSYELIVARLSKKLREELGR